MKVNTSELTGPTLRYAVAQCLGYNVGVLTAEDTVQQQLVDETDPERIAWIKEAFSKKAAVPCFISTVDGYKHTVNMLLYADTGCAGMQWDTNWSQGGPIIEREDICLDKLPDNGHRAFQRDATGRQINFMDCWFSTKLETAMRCFVASKLGNEVDVPEELLS